MPQRRAALEKLVLHATNLRIPIVEVEGGSLTALAGFDGHQGIALVVEPRRFASLDDILARAAERGEPPFVLVLDSLEDPHNVGSLLRSAEAAGVHGVVFPTHRQAPLSPSAVKASAGAIEHLLLSPADDLPAALSDLHSRGLRIAGADGGASLSARQTDLRGPLAIVVGSEGQGLGQAVRRRCDVFMRIPMKGAVGSLNAAVAGSILLFEALSQREDVEALPPPAPPESSSPTEPSTEPPRPAPKPRKPRAKKVAVEATPADPAPADTPSLPDADVDLLPDDAAPTAPKAAKPRKAAEAAKVAKTAKAPTRTKTAKAPTRKRPRTGRGRQNRRPAAGRRAPSQARMTGSGPRPPTLDPSDRSVLSSPGAEWVLLRYGPARRADVAQLVEQRFCKPPVPGSSPVVGSRARPSVVGSATGPQSRSGAATPVGRLSRW